MNKHIQINCHKAQFEWLATITQQINCDHASQNQQKSRIAQFCVMAKNR